MADVKWIKITTDIFDDDKILLIEALPEADTIITIWFKLLCLAGKQNNSGVFMLNDRITYTPKMLATIFRRKESSVELALQTFEEFGMIEIIDNVITIPNWSKHQTLDQIEERKDYMKEYMKKYREKQKEIACKVNSKVNSKVNVNSLDKNKIRKEEDKNRLDNNINESSAEESQNEKPKKHKYGEYGKVLLTDIEYGKLKESYPNYYESFISKVDRYKEKSGKTYKSDCLAILDFMERDGIKTTSINEKENSKVYDLIINGSGCYTIYETSTGWQEFVRDVVLTKQQEEIFTSIRESKDKDKLQKFIKSLM